jgi:hypothetical protein
MVDYLNPKECHRAASCLYYGQVCVKPQKCCDICHPDDKKAHQDHIKRWIAAREAAKQALTAQLTHSKDDFPILEKDLQEDAAREFKLWHEQVWDTGLIDGVLCRGLPIEWIAPDAQLKKLSENMHLVTNRERFLSVLKLSGSAFNELTDNETASLWSLAKDLNLRYAELHSERVASRQKAKQTAKKPKK